MRKIFERACAEFIEEPIKTTFCVLICVYSLVYTVRLIFT